MVAEKVGKVVRMLPLPTARDLVGLYRVRAVRKLSQNFLLDERMNNRIVKCAGRKLNNCEVLEVGPGPGNITRSILSKQAERIILVEKDKRFLPTLELLKDAAPQPIHIVWDDILLYDMSNTFSENKRTAWDDEYPNIHIIGNLPFSVSTPLILRWMKNICEQTSAWSYGRVRMTLTFQKEVAERLQAPVMTTQRCRLSVMCQNFCHIQTKFFIPGSAFSPKPKVDVGVVHFRPYIKPIIPLPFDLIEKVVRCIFRHRQKRIIRGLEYLFPTPYDETLPQEICKEAEIDSDLRAFQLSVEEIGRLCESYKRIIDAEPKFANFKSSNKKDENMWLRKEEEEQRKIDEWKKEQLLNEDFY